LFSSIWKTSENDIYKKGAVSQLMRKKEMGKLALSWQNREMILNFKLANFLINKVTGITTSILTVIENIVNVERRVLHNQVYK
jgi:hypothetical protein